MLDLNTSSLFASLTSRNELIALPQLIAMNLDPTLFQEETPLIIISNGSGNAGKSLISTAFGAQLMNIRTANVDVIGETTLQDENQPLVMRLHFIDAAEVCENPYDLIKDGSGERKDLEAFKRELKEKGDIIFLQNVPPDFREIADMEFVVTTVDEPEHWQRFASIMLLNDRIKRAGFGERFRNINEDVIAEAAALLPDNYLMPDGEVYGPIIGQS